MTFVVVVVFGEDNWADNSVQAQLLLHNTLNRCLNFWSEFILLIRLLTMVQLKHTRMTGYYKPVHYSRPIERSK